MKTQTVRAPLPPSRRAQLLEALRRDGTVRVSDLTEALGVAAVTVRRDIAQLAREGLVERVHGGATLAQHDLDNRPGGISARPAAGGSIGVLVPSLDYYWPEVVRGAEEAAQERGLRVVLRGSSYEADDEALQLTRLVEKLGVDSLMIAPRLNAPSARRTTEWLRRSPVPVVLVERESHDGLLPELQETVVSDHALGATMAVRHLTTLGHDRVGLVLSERSPTSAHLRRGWLSAAQDHGFDAEDTVELTVPPASESPWDEPLDAVLDEVLRTGTTALLVHADREAIALVQRAEKRSISVPESLSVVAYDDEMAGLFSPALTAVHPPRAAIGRAAVDLISQRLADPARPPHRVHISPELRIRESTAPPPG